MHHDIGSKENQEKAKAARLAKDALISKFTSENSAKSNYLRLVPRSYRSRLYDLYNGAKSLSVGIKMKCYDCSGYNRDEVINCTVTTCPLHNLRPRK